MVKLWLPTLALARFLLASNVQGSGAVDDMILDQEQMDWLKSGLLHGELDDLIVNENTPKAPAMSASALRDPNKLWPNKIVYYSFDATLKSSQQNTVRTTLSGLQDKLSCLTFQEKNDGNRIIVGTSGVGCRSEVGYKAMPQYLNLASLCWGTGTIEHEFLHAIGIYHHQSRSDRDKHVKIITNNIIDDKKSNFNKYDQTRIFSHFLPYDYRSVMHYGKSYFAKIPGDITIETLDPTKQDVIGNRDGVTSGDIELVRRAYGCSDRSCEVHVGNSTTNTTSATVTEGCVCPMVINKSNWLAGDTSHDYTLLTDEFAVTQDGSSLVVQRTDSNYGWGMDLTFMCSRQVSGEAATSSSIFSDDSDKWGPQYSIDTEISTGNTKYFHSKIENYPWLQIPLKPTTKVFDVRIVNRKDCCFNRLKNVEIRAGMEKVLAGATNQLLAINTVCATFQGPPSTNGDVHLQCETPVDAKFITIQLKDKNAILQINEVIINELINGTCYEDDSSRLLDNYHDSATNTPDECIETCASRGYFYAGVQSTTQCFCGNVKPPASRIRDSSQCDAKCPGDASLRCGGDWRLNVYKIVKTE